MLNFGIKQMRECILEGSKLEAQPGNAQIKGRRLQDYYLPFEQFLAYCSLTAMMVEDKMVLAEGYSDKNWLRRAISQ